MEIHVSALENKWRSLKEDSSDAKKAFEGAEAELRATIREGAGQMRLPGMEGGQGRMVWQSSRMGHQRPRESRCEAATAFAL
jgi:hypothetical protein